MNPLRAFLGTEKRAMDMSPTSDFWYRAANYPGQVSPETALTIPAVFACVRVISEDVGKLPLKVYRHLPGGGKAEAPGHPLAGLLSTRPNSQQTSMEWREMMTGHALLRGAGYSKILPGPRGFVDQLIPLNPDRVKVLDLPNGDKGYQYRKPDGTTETLTYDEVLVLPGPMGLSVVQLAARGFDLALKTEQYGQSFFSKGARPSGVLEYPGKLSDEAKKNLRESTEANNAGVANAGRLFLLEGGLKWQQMDMPNNEAQFLESRHFSVEEVCRWFRVPLHLVGELVHATFSNIEEQSLEYVRDALSSWCARWEQRIAAQLLLAPETYFVKFNLDSLMRGKTLERMQAHAVAITSGIRSPNEARAIEDENPRPGGDEYQTPLNMRTTGADGSSPASPPQGRAAAVATAAASRLVRREMAAISGDAVRYAADSTGWRTRVEEFYRRHAPVVAEALAISHEEAERYCAGQRDAVLVEGPRAAESWERDIVPALARLALGIAA